MRSLNTKCTETMSACRSNSSFDTSAAPTAAAFSAVRFWLQANTRMPNARPIFATCEPRLPESNDAQRLAGQVIADGVLPAAAANRGGFGDEVARTRQNQRPGQFNRRAAEIAGVNHRDAARGRGLQIDGRVARTGGGDEFQVRQPLDQLGAQRRALAHHADDVIGKQPLHHGIRIGQMVAEYIHVRREP